MDKLNKENINKNYESPKIELIEFDYNDVIVTSGCANDGCIGDTCEDRMDCPMNIKTY